MQIRKQSEAVTDDVTAIKHLCIMLKKRNIVFFFKKKDFSNQRVQKRFLKLTNPKSDFLYKGYKKKSD